MPWPRFFTRINKESFLLTHDSWDDFILSKWSDNPLVYAIWASFCCVYTTAMVVYTGLKSEYGVKIIIWLTYWSFYCLALRFIVTFCHCWFYLLRTNKRPSEDSINHSEETSTQKILVSPEQYENHCMNDSTKDSTTVNNLPEGGPAVACPDKQSSKCGPNVSSSDDREDWTNSGCLPLGLTFQWFLQNISNAVSLLVTVLFWALVYTGEPQDYASINSHVINSLLVIGDIMISRAPIRIQHFHIPITYLGIYIVFTLIYWAAGGTNHNYQSFIYAMLDYSRRPLTATVAIAVIALFGVLLTQIFLYCLYRLRNALSGWRKTGSFNLA